MIKTALGNYIEELVQRCIDQIQDPNERALVLVPDLFLKSYVQLECIKKSSSRTFFGIDILPVEPGLERLLAKSFATLADCLISSFAHVDDEALASSVAHAAYLASSQGSDVVNREAMKLHVHHVINDPNLHHICNEKIESIRTVYTSVHLLGFSSLHSLYYRLFNTISEHIPVKSYVLSPCMMFWTDMRVKKNSSVCEPFYDHYPLLANCGKVARDYARLLEDGLHLHEEAYVLPDWAEKVRPDAVSSTICTKKTALTKLQIDLLLLQDSTESILDDDTLQVHAAPTALGEVQALHQALASISDPLEAGDILIFAPDITKYEPYLQRVFDEGQIHVYGKKGAVANGIIDGFFKLLALIESRWAAEDVLELFYCSAFLKKLGLKKEDISLIKTCMQRLGVYWAVTNEQKTTLVGKSSLYAGTFEEFQEEFLDLWIRNQHPKVEIAAVDAEKLGLVLQCIFSLYRVQCGPSTLSAFSDICEKLLESYFSSDDMDEYIVLAKAIQRMKKSALGYKEKLFSQQMVIQILRQCVHEQQESFDAMPRGMISCASLGSFRAVPAKVIAFLGMNEVQFPRNIGSYAFDKHLFLEALISARSHVLICYQNYDFEQQSALKACSAVMDLLHSYPVKVISHPIDAYVCKESVSDEIQQFFSLQTASGPLCQLQMSDLNKIARSPLNPYFQKQGINLYEEKLQAFGDEFATLSTRHHNQMKKTAFFMSKDQAEAFVANECKHLPQPVKKAYSEGMLREYDELHAHAKAFGIIDVEPSSITFSLSTDKVCEVSNGVWHVPAITIDGRCVTGRLEHIHKMGHFAFFGKDVQAVISLWPHLIATSYAARFYGIPLSSDVLFLQTGSKMTVSFSDPEASLKAFIKYVELCHQRPVCLYPEWIDAIVSNETIPEMLLDKAIRDPYLQFYVSKCDPSMIKAEWPFWHGLAKSLFQPVLQVCDEL